MTVTEPSALGTPAPEQRTALATLVGETVAALLPALERWAVRTDLPGTGLPDGPCTAVGARLGDHVVVLVTSVEMAERLQDAASVAGGLDGDLTPVVQAVAEVLGLEPAAELVPMDVEAVAGELTTGSLRCGLLDGAQHHATVVVTPPDAGLDEAGPDAASFEPIVGNGTAGPQSGLEVLHDVEMGVTVELGRTRMPLRDILTVVPGSVIELDRAASAPVDVLVNGTLIARGEVVVIDEEFGIRITEVVGREQTIHGDPTS